MLKANNNLRKKIFHNKEDLQNSKIADIVCVCSWKIGSVDLCFQIKSLNPIKSMYGNMFHGRHSDSRVVKQFELNNSESFYY